MPNLVCRRAAGAACVLLAAPTVPAAATTPLLISPTVIEIPEGHRSAAVEVTNEGDENVDIQLRTYEWTQANGADALAPSSRLIVSPAITTIAPHKTQLFRLLDLSPPQAGERSFRIKLNELPAPAQAHAVRVDLEFSLPVFATRPGSTPDLRWESAGRLLRVVNWGGRRVRLSQLALVTKDGRRIDIVGSGPAYVLAGSGRTWATPDSAGGRLVGMSDAGPIDVELAILASL